MSKQVVPKRITAIITLMHSPDGKECLQLFDHDGVRYLRVTDDKGISAAYAFTMTGDTAILGAAVQQEMAQ